MGILMCMDTVHMRTELIYIHIYVGTEALVLEQNLVQQLVVRLRGIPNRSGRSFLPLVPPVSSFRERVQRP